MNTLRNNKLVSTLKKYPLHVLLLAVFFILHSNNYYAGLVPGKDIFLALMYPLSVVYLLSRKTWKKLFQIVLRSNYNIYLLFVEASTALSDHFSAQTQLQGYCQYCRKIRPAFRMEYFYQLQGDVSMPTQVPGQLWCAQ